MFSELATLGGKKNGTNLNKLQSNSNLYSILIKGNLRALSWWTLVDTTNSSTRPLWESWARKNIAAQTYGLPGNQSEFNTINTTSYKYGIYTRNSKGFVRADDVVPGGDPRFKNYLFPVWQVAPLATSSAAVFLDGHSTVGTRHDTIEKVLAGKAVFVCGMTLLLYFLPNPSSHPLFDSG